MTAALRFLAAFLFANPIPSSSCDPTDIAGLDQAALLQLTSRSIPHFDNPRPPTELMEEVHGLLSEDVEKLEQMLQRDRQQNEEHVKSNKLVDEKKQECPEGYRFSPGDVPGGDAFGRGFSNVIDSITSCAVDCENRPDCLSFEYSPTSENCYLNKVGTPTARRLGDTLFCSKASMSLAQEPGNLFDLIDDPSKTNITKKAATPGNAAAKPQGWMTFHGRFSKPIGSLLWGVGVLVLLFMICGLLWCCYCWLSTCWDDGYVTETEEDEDRELHEVWVKAASKK